jgi:hypothetical protein
MSGIIGGAGSKSGIIGETELDYEEGTFTASMTGTSGDPTGGAVNATNAYYTKIGRLVYFNIRRFQAINVNGASGIIKITGLPFSAHASYVVTDITWYNFPMDSAYSAAFEGAGSTLTGLLSTDDAVWIDWPIEADGATRYMSISGTYETS